MQIVDALVIVDQLGQDPAVILKRLPLHHQEVLGVLLGVVLAGGSQDDDPLGYAVDFGGVLQALRGEDAILRPEVLGQVQSLQQTVRHLWL